MAWVGAAVAAALIILVLLDAFEVVVLPRRIAHPFRLARLYYQATWSVWRAAARRISSRRWRSGFLAAFGPLSLFGLLVVWAVGLIVGFALLHWSLDTSLSLPPETEGSFFTYLYFSGTTFFTLGYGDVVPTRSLGRALSVFESGLGFGFLAVVISYLPILYQTFSRREITISLLDARAGSPPAAGELLKRMAASPNLVSIGPLLVEWERWSAELLESHVSYAVLRFYRSQHDNQSWVAALTTILDTSALLIACVENADTYQARLTFAMARHAAVDLGLVSQTPPLPPEPDRLPPSELKRLQVSLQAAGLPIREGPAAATALAELRAIYEPFVNGLATRLLFSLPPFLPVQAPVDNWQTSAWTPRAPGFEGLPGGRVGDDHFD